jgi:hypothetical protein
VTVALLDKEFELGVSLATGHMTLTFCLRIRNTLDIFIVKVKNVIQNLK